MSRLTPSTHPTHPPPSTQAPSPLPHTATYFPLHMLMLQSHSVGGFVSRKGGGKRPRALGDSCMHFTKLTPRWLLGLSPIYSPFPFPFQYFFFFSNVWLVDEEPREDLFVFILAAKLRGFLYQQVADRFNARGRARSQWAHYHSGSRDLRLLLLFGFMVPMKMGGLA